MSFACSVSYIISVLSYFSLVPDICYDYDPTSHVAMDPW